ncbi:hypothetical protein GCM10009630_59640 [Kribbella jejuensis]
MAVDGALGGLGSAAEYAVEHQAEEAAGCIAGCFAGLVRLAPSPALFAGWLVLVS